MIRFTETNKWHDPWFMGLRHGSKLLFIYLIENCDNAGFYEINEKLLLISLDITSQQFKGALKDLGRGIEGPSEGWLRVKNFLKHQKNAHLNPVNPAHKQIITLLEAQIKRFPEVKTLLPNRSPSKGASKGLRSPIGTGTGTGTGTKKGESEGEEKLRPFDPQAIQLATCVGRGPDTPWSDKEIKSWKALRPPLDQTQLDRLSVYYAKNRKKEKNICRRDLFTLLNNYRGECDRADAWYEKYKRAMPKEARANIRGEVPPTPEADARYRKQFEQWKEAGRPLGADLEKFFPSNGETEPKPKETDDAKKQ